MRLLACERLALLALRQQAAKDETDLRTTLFTGRARDIDDRDGPQVVCEVRARVRRALLVWRDGVLVANDVRPTVAIGELLLLLQGPRARLAVCSPRELDGVIRVLRVGIDEDDRRIVFRRGEDRRRAA